MSLWTVETAQGRHNCPQCH